MGYTTTFTGTFKLSKLPGAETIVALRQFENLTETNLPGQPDSYCQWVLTPDCRGIKWDGGEKFYHYEEWLQYLMDTFLKHEGITLSGEVKFKGEDPGDRGVLTVKDGKVVRSSKAAIPDDAKTLKRFKAFVLASEWADGIVAAWAEENE